MFMRMIYDDDLAQAAYLIGCQMTGEAIVIDPERDVERYIDLATANGLRIVAVAETHIHADFLSGARELAERIGAKVYVSDEGGTDWKYRWLDARSGGGLYDYRLLLNGDTFSIGNIDFRVVHTPGHTPEHIAFLVTDRGGGATEPVGMLSGDFLFVGDLGRPDLLESAAGVAGAMEPSARRLFGSVAAIRTLPEFVQVWPGHGAGSSCGKALGAIPSTTIGYETRFNPAIAAATSEKAFVDFILAGQPEPPVYFANMKRDNREGPRVLGGLPQPPLVSIDDLRRLDPRRAAIIDTRTWDEFRTGHIPGSLYIPLGTAFCTDAGSLVGEDEDIYLIARPEQAAHAVRLLIRIGLDNIRGWLDAGQVGGFATTATPLATIEDRSSTEAADMIERREVRVLDVRRATEFAEGHLPRATNIAHTRLAARLDEVPEGTLLINCRGGGRSARAAAYLKRRGHEVVNLAGGYLGWEQAHPHAANRRAEHATPESDSPVRVVNLNPEQLAEHMQRHEVVLVDVREDDEYTAENIPGAHPLPLGRVTRRDVLRITGDKPVVFQCRSGKRSVDAALRFGLPGERVFHLAGGILGWKESGRPTTASPPSPSGKPS